MAQRAVDLLVLVCHEDDELYCAGTVKKYTDAGLAVGVVYLTQGGQGHPLMSEEQTKRIRVEEARKACAILATQPPEFLDYPDAFVPYSQNLTLEVTNLIRKYRARAVVTHNLNTTQTDHRNAALCVMDSVMLLGLPNVKTEYPPFNGFREIYCMPQSARKMPGQAELPVIYVDVSDVIETVEACACCYQSQIEAKAMSWRVPADGKIPDNLPACYPGVIERDERAGKACGVKYAEVFETVFGAGNFAHDTLPIQR
jgi:LmbE family N-acetylglucosaminyl deacetylase